MTHRVFLDVGANKGQTLDEVTKPTYGFDRFHAFEPMPDAFVALRAAYSDRIDVDLHAYGLSDRTATVDMYGNNINLGASIFKEKADVEPNVVTEVEMVRASTWVEENVSAGDVATMKLNCEGAEVLILRDLCETGTIHRLATVLIDFDISKVRGRENEELRVITSLAEVGFHRYVVYSQAHGTAPHGLVIARWLQDAKARGYPC